MPIVRAFRVGLFTECYQPIQNGIVASLAALAASLRAHDRDYVLVTPEMPNFHDTDPHVVRVPSLPLPTRTSYRLTVPYLPRTLRDVSIVHTHSAFVTGWLGACAARRARVPLVFTYHTQLEAYAHYVPFRSDVTRSAATQLTRAYANFADAVIVPTRAMEAHLRALGVRSQIEVVPSGIDCTHFARGERRDDVRARFRVGSNDRMILTVGRLGREKNIELALEAFARIDDERARFVVVGDGTHREVLERATARIGITDRVCFAGEYARADLPDVYASADAFIFTSSSETQGLVLVEALAANVPIVAVDTPQTADVLGSDGRLVAHDPSALAAALREVLCATPAHVRGRSSAGECAIAERFDAEKLGLRVIALYDALALSWARQRRIPIASTG